jgi:UV DNA damage endonuclease
VKCYKATLKKIGSTGGNDQKYKNTVQKSLRPVGETARRLGVRISFHPGQFCVLASESDEIVERSILEFEYHADMARWMGYGALARSWF